MRFAPMSRNVDATGQPYAVMAFHIFDETLQRAEAARPPRQPAVQAHGHRFWPAVAAFLVKRVEGVLHVGEGLLTVREAGLDAEAHVVYVERVWNDEKRIDGVAMPVMVEPVGQVVVIGVGAIFEAARF